MADVKELKNMKKITVDGVDYTVQKLPVRQALELREQWQPDGNVDEVKMFDLVLEHFVIQPKKVLDDFEDVVTVEELVAEVLKYQYKTKGK